MSRLLLLLAAATAVLLVVPSASAFELTISGLDTAPPALAPGETYDQAFTVLMVAKSSQNIICANEATLTVTLAATKADASNGLGASVAPTSVDFTIPAGAHLGGAGSGWSGTEQSGTLTVDVAENLAPGHTAHTYGVKADFAGGAPAGCQGDFPPTSQEADYRVPLDPPVDEGPNTTETAASPSPTDTDEPSEESPAPGLVFALGAIGLAALLRRRQA